MQNLLVETIAAAMLFSSPAMSTSLAVPSLEAKQLHSHKEMIIGKPEEKLQFLLDQCTTSDDVERLARASTRLRNCMRTSRITAMPKSVICLQFG